AHPEVAQVVEQLVDPLGRWQGEGRDPREILGASRASLGGELGRDRREYSLACVRLADRQDDRSVALPERGGGDEGAEESVAARDQNRAGRCAVHVHSPMQAPARCATTFRRCRPSAVHAVMSPAANSPRTSAKRRPNRSANTSSTGSASASKAAMTSCDTSANTG